MSGVHLLAQVLLHRMQPLLHQLRRRRTQRVPFHANLLQLLQASDGVRQGPDLVVANVEFHEGQEESHRVGEGVQVLEVLAHV
uniref:Uncharacterized protein n=1 Tax=Glycine max TaxID=3847 RepID=C6TBC4_SOYBN|nr:unknown [Glycine max]